MHWFFVSMQRYNWVQLGKVQVRYSWRYSWSLRSKIKPLWSYEFLPCCLRLSRPYIHLSSSLFFSFVSERMHPENYLCDVWIGNHRKQESWCQLCLTNSKTLLVYYERLVGENLPVSCINIDAGGLRWTGVKILTKTKRNEPLSPGQTIATCQRNISQHCCAQHVACVWLPRVLQCVATCWVLLAQIWK